MRKTMLGFSLMLSASFGLTPIINGIMKYVLSYNGSHQKWLIFNLMSIPFTQNDVYQELMFGNNVTNNCS